MTRNIWQAPIPEGGGVRNPHDLSSRVDGAGHGEHEAEYVAVEVDDLLPEEHGEREVPLVLLHLEPGEGVALEDADQRLHAGVQTVHVLGHGDDSEEDVAAADSLYHLHHKVQ